jgi:hypothetical protein
MKHDEKVKVLGHMILQDRPSLIETTHPHGVSTDQMVNLSATQSVTRMDAINARVS